jgi:hypothetical protein
MSNEYSSLGMNCYISQRREREDFFKYSVEKIKSMHCRIGKSM